jgi:hypothetical protein
MLRGWPWVAARFLSQCRFLRVDPVQLPRIEELTATQPSGSPRPRRGLGLAWLGLAWPGLAWLGEVAALEYSLKHLRQRRAEAGQKVRPAVTPLPAPGG